MWIADNWKDYEVIDCSNGEKLERWGYYLLVRPDPQVIWNTKKNHKGWKQMNGHYHRSKKGDKLGLVFGKDPKRGTPGKSFESFCLYRRRNSCGSGRRSACHPCGRLKRHGRLGERKRSVFRAERRSDPLACR